MFWRSPVVIAVLMAASFPHSSSAPHEWRSFVLISVVMWAIALGSTIVWLRACLRPHPCWALQTVSGGLLIALLITESAIYSTGRCYDVWKIVRVAHALASGVQCTRIVLMRAVLHDQPMYPPANQTFEGALLVGVSLLSNACMSPAIRLYLSDMSGIAS
eukprot:947118-Prymnesium_polylepis.1